MCGIAGVYNYNGAVPVSEAELFQVRDYMINRGPDGAGCWISSDRTVGLAHRRLAIIDLSAAGLQPMHVPQHGISIVFNGEIYNYRELREWLTGRGYRFHSNSDTEVLLQLYAETQLGMFQHLRGMYAFAIWDQHKRRLLMGRDPFGIKPLYYCDDGKSFWFASQVKALLPVSPTLDPDPAGHVGFHLWGHVPEPHTLFRAIRSVPAGTSILLDAKGERRENCFWKPEDFLAHRRFGRQSIANVDARANLRAIMIDSVKAHLVSDVPVGLFLSSGRDSSTLLGLASELSESELRTVTMGFKSYSGTEKDETGVARDLSARYGARHHEELLTDQQLTTSHPEFLAAMDQPTVDGLNMYLVSFAASQAGLKVAWSGVGGDEIFAGYESFRTIPKLVSRTAPFRRLGFVGRFVRVVSDSLVRNFINPKYAGVLEYGPTVSGAYLLRRGLYMPWELFGLLHPDIVRKGLEELKPLIRIEDQHSNIPQIQQKLCSLELSCYLRNQLLRDGDWASMAHSIEVRTPLVDSRLFENIIQHSIQFGWPTKENMAQTPSQRLPDSVLNRTKTGFGVPSVDPRFETDGLRTPSHRVWARYVYHSYWLDACPQPDLKVLARD